MTIKPKLGWFLAFTAAFAVLAGFVFWGTWSLDRVPVMPDCPTAFPLDYVEHWLRGWSQSGKFVPGDLAVFLGTPAFWVELQYVLALYCAALGLVYFLRGHGLPRSAAYGAGLLLAFSGYWLTLFSAGHLGWFQWMTYGVFAFGLVDRALLKGKVRHWVLLGACLAWGSFYQPDLWLMFTVFTAVYFLFRWIAEARRRRATGTPVQPLVAAFFPARWLKGAALTLAAFLLIGLASFRSAICSDLAGRDQQIAEGQTVGAVEDEALKRWLFVTNWSMPPEDTLEFFHGRAKGDTSCPLTLAIGRARGNGIRPYTGRLGCPKELENEPERGVNYRQHSLYVGWLTCLLALAGLGAPFVCRKRASLILFLTVAALVFWIFSLGRYCEPVYRLVYRLPMGDYLRAPVKWHHLTEFCLVALAGCGLEVLARLLRRTKLDQRLSAGLVLALALVGAGDLALNARRFCAPHRAGCQLVPAQLCHQASFPSDPARRVAFAREAAQNGYAVVGWETLAPHGTPSYDLPYLMPAKGLKGVCGEMTQHLASGDELHVPVVDYWPGPSPLRSKENALKGAAAVLAWVSVLATAGVLAGLGACLFNRHFDHRRLT